MGSTLPIEEVVLVGEDDLFLSLLVLSLGSRLRDQLAADDRELLHEILGLPLPGLRRPELRPGGGEGRIVPALGEPGGIVDDAQAAERLDQAQGRAVEGPELLV